jgi:glycine/D-amino acid oxidase-like deaminating enzyme
MEHDILIIGAGIFGTTAALALQQRGRQVTLIDSGPLPHPHPLASSTDISKVVRMEYGADGTYMAMVEEAMDGWRLWNKQFSEPLFHETGVVMLTREQMRPAKRQDRIVRLVRNANGDYSAGWIAGAGNKLVSR